MLKRTVLLLAGLVIGAAAASPPARAQSLEVYRLTDLSFGTFIAGDVVTVQPSEPGAASFRVDKLAGGERDVQVRLTLPAALELGGASLPVSFGSVSAAWSTTNDPSTATAFDPAQGVDVRLPGRKPLYVWVGGTVASPAQLPSGACAQRITLTATLP